MCDQKAGTSLRKTASCLGKPDHVIPVIISWRCSCGAQVRPPVERESPPLCPSVLFLVVAMNRSTGQLQTRPYLSLSLPLSYTVSLSPSSSPNSLTVKGRKTCRWQNAQVLSCERREKSNKSHYTSHKKNNAEKGFSIDIPRCNRYSYPQHFL